MIRQTSVDVFRKIEAEGLLSKLRFKVYQSLFHHGPMTAMEVVAHLAAQGDRIKQVSISPRMSELRDFGVVQELGEKICRVTGTNSILWDVTSDLPKVRKSDHAATKAERIAALTRENVSLKMQLSACRCGVQQRLF